MWSVLRNGLVAVIVVLVCCSPVYVSAEPESAPAQSLVVVDLSDSQDPARVAALGIVLLDVQPRRLAALAGESAQRALQTAGLPFHVLDADGLAPSSAYYLVAPGFDADVLALPADVPAFPYGEGSALIEAGPAQIEAVVAAGASVQRLGDGVVPYGIGETTAATASALAAARYSPGIQRLISEVSQGNLSNTVRDLQDDDALAGWDALQSRHVSSDGLATERAYLAGRLRALGATYRELPFALYSSTQYNLETTLEGWGDDNEPVYIVCAHYDSTSDDPDHEVAPGADDNASGVAGMLEVGRILSRYRFERPIRLVAFAAEEQGLVGSQVYAAQVVTDGLNVGGVFNLDMIGWDSDDDGVMDVNVGAHSNSWPLGTHFMEMLETYDIPLQPVYSTHPLTIRSDHASFWNQDVPAMLATEHSADHNAYYHTTSDTLSALNLPYATRMAQATLATVADLAGLIPPGMRVAQSGPQTLGVGQQILLTVQYSNPGPDAASDVALSGRFGSGLAYVSDTSGLAVEHTADGVRWRVGDLAPYTRRTFQLTLQCGTGGNVAVSSVVSISGNVAWDDASDNQGTWSASIAAPDHALYLPAVRCMH
ncbi:MAG: M20/M25/M40 family metallo-hydrolase [Anaerolineae bacterium]